MQPIQLVNKLNSITFYVTAVVDIASIGKHGLRIEVHHKNQPKKTKTSTVAKSLLSL